MENTRTKNNIFTYLWTTVGIIVIAGFLVFSMIIGGSASLGYQENGHFFVRDHSYVIEVTESIWKISRIWESLFWIFIPLTPLGAFVITTIQKKITQH